MTEIPTVIVVLLFGLAVLDLGIGLLERVVPSDKPCTHPRLHSTKWLADDGTPMMHSWCPDCGRHDTGHVHADPTTWLEKKSRQL